MRFSLLLASIVLFSGCAIRYVPNSLNVPLPKEKNEFKTSLNVNTDSQDLQASYSMTKHTAMMLNISNMNKDKDDEKIENILGEAGIGMYHNFTPNIVNEFYAGYGRGHIKSKEITNNTALGDIIDRFDSDYNKYFIQHNLGLRKSIWIFALTSRFTDIQFSDYNNSTKYSHSVVFYEPGFTIKAGDDRFKVYSQILLSFPITDRDISYDPGKIVFGAEYNWSYHK
jgi:hypothetical protein